MGAKFKLKKWQIDLIKQKISKMKPKELAKLAKVSVKVVYNRRCARGGWLSENMPILEDKKKIQRPPAIYTNKRLYDQL